MRRVGRTKKKGGPSLVSLRKYFWQKLPPYGELLLLLLVLLGPLLPLLLLLLSQRGFFLLGYFVYSLLAIQLILLALLLLALYRPRLGFLKPRIDVPPEKGKREVYYAYYPQQSLVLLSFLQVFGFLFQEKTKDVLFFLLS